jgi:hypothetical protein
VLMFRMVLPILCMACSGRCVAQSGAPWVTFDAPIVVEDTSFPGMQQWPKEFVLKDEIYQMKDWSRQNLRVLMRLDSGKVDLTRVLLDVGTRGAKLG